MPDVTSMEIYQELRSVRKSWTRTNAIADFVIEMMMSAELRDEDLHKWSSLKFVRRFSLQHTKRSLCLRYRPLSRRRPSKKKIQFYIATCLSVCREMLSCILTCVACGSDMCTSFLVMVASCHMPKKRRIFASHASPVLHFFPHFFLVLCTCWPFWALTWQLKDQMSLPGLHSVVLREFRIQSLSALSAKDLILHS